MRFCVWCFSPLCSGRGCRAHMHGGTKAFGDEKEALLCSILAASSSDAFFPFRESKAQRGLIIVTSKCVFCFSLSRSDTTRGERLPSRVIMLITSLLFSFARRKSILQFVEKKMKTIRHLLAQIGSL